MPAFFFPSVPTFVVVIVYHPCGLIISLAVRQQTNVTHQPAPVMGPRLHSMVYSQSALTFTVMTQSEAHNVDQAWWPGECVCERENNRLCRCLWGKEKRLRESVCTYGQTDFKQLYSLYTSIFKPVGS